MHVLSDCTAHLPCAIDSLSLPQIALAALARCTAHACVAAELLLATLVESVWLSVM